MLMLWSKYGLKVNINKKNKISVLTHKKTEFPKKTGLASFLDIQILHLGRVFTVFQGTKTRKSIT